MNPCFDFLKGRYQLGHQTDKGLKAFVVAGKLSPEEYEEITGKPYKD